MDALPQIVHRAQMFLPVIIQLLQHDLFFHMPHQLRTDRLLLDGINVVEFPDAALENPIVIEFRIRFQPLRDIRVVCKFVLQRMGQTIGVPLLFHAAGWNVLRNERLHDFVANRSDGVLDLIGCHQL